MTEPSEVQALAAEIEAAWQAWAGQDDPPGGFHQLAAARLHARGVRVTPSPAPVPEGPYVLTPERVVPLLRSIVASGERLYSEDVDAIASTLAAPVAPDRTEGLRRGGTGRRGQGPNRE